MCDESCSLGLFSNKLYIYITFDTSKPRGIIKAERHLKMDSGPTPFLNPRGH